MFAALDDGRVVHRWWHRGGWSDWSGFGTVGAVDLAVCHRRGRELEVFAVTATGTLLHRRYQPGADDWSGWQEMALP
jgi:hypothetical protein